MTLPSFDPRLRRTSRVPAILWLVTLSAILGIGVFLAITLTMSTTLRPINILIQASTWSTVAAFRTAGLAMLLGVIELAILGGRLPGIRRRVTLLVVYGLAGLLGGWLGGVLFPSDRVSAVDGLIVGAVTGGFASLLHSRFSGLSRLGRRWFVWHLLFWPPLWWIAYQAGKSASSQTTAIASTAAILSLGVGVLTLLFIWRNRSMEL